MEHHLDDQKPTRILAPIHGALAVLIPAIIALVAGLGLWLFTFKKRRALNSMTTLLGWTGSFSAGLRLDIEGQGIATKQRPAIFIFNHQSGIDPIILCRVLQKNVIGVAKIELKYHWIIGPLLKFGDTLFVDRDNEQSKSQVLSAAEGALANSLSIAISPEGTRSRRTELGQFRSGAFRLARYSRRPIVPIVIVDSSKVLPARSLDMRPGRVKVKILPPIHPDDWADLAPNTMAKKMHCLYVDTLKTLSKEKC